MSCVFVLEYPENLLDDVLADSSRKEGGMMQAG